MFSRWLKRVKRSQNGNDEYPNKYVDFDKRDQDNELKNKIVKLKRDCEKYAKKSKQNISQFSKVRGCLI